MNSCGAVKIAPQWSALGTSHKMEVGLAERWVLGAWGMKNIQGAILLVRCGDEQSVWVQLFENLHENGRLFARWRVNDEIKFLMGGFMTTDPVCGMRVDENRTEFHTHFAGKRYSFCSEDCKLEFEADPDEFVEIAAA